MRVTPIFHCEKVHVGRDAMRTARQSGIVSTRLWGRADV